MKKTLLTVFALLLVASVAHAYVQAGHLQQTQKPQPNSASMVATDPGVGAISPSSPAEPAPASVQPTQPVPEPGTMALASMGLLALGVAARRSRRKE
jgi:hypothetical protein